MIIQSITEPARVSPLPAYFWDRLEWVVIEPKHTIWYSINWTEVTPDTIEWVKHWTTARFLQIETPFGKIKVIEHFISALRAAWIQAANIRFSGGLMPVVWPWIDPVYSKLKMHSKLKEIWEVDDYVVGERQEFHHWNATMIIEPSDTFDIVIDTNHSDLVDLWSKALEIIDVTWSLVEHINARPIARLQNKVTHTAYKLLRWFPVHLNGIWPESYIITSPWETSDEIVAKMGEKYQDDRNEHLYHTMVSDFLWELAIFFPWDFKWKITLLNTNHTSRVELLRQLYSS